MKESFENGQENDPAALIEKKTREEAELFETAFNAAPEGERRILVTGYGQAEGLMTEIAVRVLVNNSEQEG